MKTKVLYPWEGTERFKHVNEIINKKEKLLDCDTKTKLLRRPESCESNIIRITEKALIKAILMSKIARDSRDTEFGFYMLTDRANNVVVDMVPYPQMTNPVHVEEVSGQATEDLKRRLIEAGYELDASHSHVNMGAFHSGTDMDNLPGKRSVTIGRIDELYRFDGNYGRFFPDTFVDARVDVNRPCGIKDSGKAKVEVIPSPLEDLVQIGDEVEKVIRGIKSTWVNGPSTLVKSDIHCIFNAVIKDKTKADMAYTLTTECLDNARDKVGVLTKLAERIKTDPCYVERITKARDANSDCTIFQVTGLHIKRETIEKMKLYNTFANEWGGVKGDFGTVLGSLENVIDIDSMGRARSKAKLIVDEITNKLTDGGKPSIKIGTWGTNNEELLELSPGIKVGLNLKNVGEVWANATYSLPCGVMIKKEGLPITVLKSDEVNGNEKERIKQTVLDKYLPSLKTVFGNIRMKGKAIDKLSSYASTVFLDPRLRFFVEGHASDTNVTIDDIVSNPSNISIGEVFASNKCLKFPDSERTITALLYGENPNTETLSINTSTAGRMPVAKGVRIKDRPVMVRYGFDFSGDLCRVRMIAESDSGSLMEKEIPGFRADTREKNMRNIIRDFYSIVDRPLACPREIDLNLEKGLLFGKYSEKARCFIVNEVLAGEYANVLERLQGAKEKGLELLGVIGNEETAKRFENAYAFARNSVRGLFYIVAGKKPKVTASFALPWNERILYKRDLVVI